MANYSTVIFYSLIGGLFSLVGGLLLISSKKRAKALAEYGMPFAAGALLAAVFLDLLQEGVEQTKAENVFMAALLGIFLFFFAERFLHWFHHHHQHDKGDPATSLIVIGDTVHNALDGIAIAAAFLVSVPTGIVTTIAIAAHEIPQEIGDFGLLLSKGMKRRNVLLVNILSSLATVVTAVIVFTIGQNNTIPTGVLLGLSAGFLLYIALSDIIPTIHEKAENKKIFELQPLLMLLGACLVAASIQLAHKYTHTDDHSQQNSNIQVDAQGVPHGDPAHDHGTMQDSPTSNPSDNDQDGHGHH